jgi:hypothetical protein
LCAGEPEFGWEHLRLFVTPKYGTDVANRFLERLKYIPSQTEVLSTITRRPAS